MAQPQNKDALIENIRKSIIGADEVINTPFGQRKVVYCDYTASSRSLSFIEDYIRAEVLPLYANTHTTSSTTGYQTALFREEARTIIGRSLNARDDKDAVIFTGSGVTGAINHLVRAMRLWPKRELPAEERPIVFVGPHEHHSNILPWRESICDVEIIPEHPDTGVLDEAILEAQLKKYSSRPMRIGSFSAASNVTGALVDTMKVTKLLHDHGALSFWDYASAGPYETVDMNPVVNANGEDRNLYLKDAIFVSPHKFIGGPGTPGILIAKKVLFDRKLPPVAAGGGTVVFVTSVDHVYLNNISEREEAGTPDIIGCIRAGLVLQLKNAIGAEAIMQRENQLLDYALQKLRKNPAIHVLGRDNQRRLPTLSFVIFHQSGRLLHYNFICALLNDLFGIQSRGGCVCAGPYGQQLLGISLDTAKKYEEELVAVDEAAVVRPGFARLCFPFFMSQEEVDYALDAIDFVAREGYKMLPLYSFQPETAKWFHQKLGKTIVGRKWLGDITYDAETGQMKYPRRSEKVEPPADIRVYLEEAQQIVTNTYKMLRVTLKTEEFTTETEMLRAESEKLRWFVYPAEAFFTRIEIDDKENNIRNAGWRACFGQYCPFVPVAYAGAAVASEPAPAPAAVTPPPASSPAPVSTKPERITIDLGAGAAAAMETEPSDRASVKKIVDDRAKAAAQPGKGWEKQYKKEKTAADIAHEIFTSTKKAVYQYGMIKDGDRVMVAVSGGKDSLTLLNTLIKLRQTSAFKFELAAVTIDPQTLEYNPAPLKDYMKELGIPYFYDSQPLISLACDVGPTSICSWCSRMKRGVLHNICMREGYNVLAMGQHLDDCVESFLMYAFHNGKLDTIRARVTVRDGSLTIIRPFVHLREKHTKLYARLHKLPVITENCPACFEEPKERARIKTLLKSQEAIHPRLFSSLLTALQPLFFGEVQMEKIEKEMRDKYSKMYEEMTTKLKENKGELIKAKREAAKEIREQRAKKRADAEAAAAEAAKKAAEEAASTAVSSIPATPPAEK